jgi:purine-nucleoside phosphorylase
MAAESNLAGMPGMTVHLHPTAELADRVLLPGDPGRALELAQLLLQSPKMFNHNRGLWGYTGPAADGELLTIQSTGMGGPSAAIVISELVTLGAGTLIRVGTCGALLSALALGDLLIADCALAADGTSRALGAPDWVPATPELSAALSAAGAQHVGPVASTDLFYDPRPGLEDGWRERGILAVEMETATLFALGARHEALRVASLLIVSDLLVPTRRRIDAGELKLAERRLGETAMRALSAPALA